MIRCHEQRVEMRDCSPAVVDAQRLKLQKQSVGGAKEVSQVYLMAELVTGHPQNDEPVRGEALVQVVHLGVIPGGGASERRHVLDKHHLPLQRRQLQLLSCQLLHCDIVK